MSGYFCPLPQSSMARPAEAVSLAGGPLWFTHAIRFGREGGGTSEGEVVPAAAIPAANLERLSAPRAPLAGLDMGRTTLMGILNTTPDSFSDGGDHNDVAAAREAALAMVAAGADIIDVGGESTRPGAVEVPVDEEIARTRPVIEAIRAQSDVPISIDTRKSAVARAAMGAGADLVNDVSAFGFDPKMQQVCADLGAPVCLMHAQGDPATMQHDPQYGDVLLDVYDALEAAVARAEAAGIARARILVDPGIGFGKSEAHNLRLLRHISLFHGIGCPMLLGVSRKGFIGRIGKAPDPKDRAAGSIAVALAGLAQGVQMLRVHDVRETASALALWRAARGL
ncbi:dihydropteroate synthase [Litorivita sp. NS0012-18]|uniref:dihydropteroate synthase n=1 Tax=Litorivita sp. NS0012-18 TaxID=3127655 RepID=UPI003105D37A